MPVILFLVIMLRMNNSYREIRFKLKIEDGVMRAGDIMRERLKLSSREVARCKLFEDGVMCEEKAVRIIDEIKPGQELVVRIYEDTDNASEIVPSDDPIDIVYEDEDIVYSKNNMKEIDEDDFEFEGLIPKPQKRLNVTIEYDEKYKDLYLDVTRQLDGNIS